MADWVSLAAARALPGLRLVLLRGLPSPWSLAARAIFELKELSFVAACSAPDDTPDALLRWTGQTSLPAAMYDDERPRTGWAEILLLAERLAREPDLLPADPRQRTLVFGLSHEICGEGGLAWNRRLLGLAPHLRERPDDPEVMDYARKYTSGPVDIGAAERRVAEVLRLLATQLGRQRGVGSRFLVGERLSAADVYWATFSNVIAPLPDDQLELPAAVREGFRATQPAILEALDPSLLAHRDFVYQRFLRLPVEI